MPVRKVAKLIRTAVRDAELARRTSHTPAFHRAVTEDRRSALREYRTVEEALQDRERMLGKKARDAAGEAAKAKKKK